MVQNSDPEYLEVLRSERAREGKTAERVSRVFPSRS
eukprot:SAG11_NODE_28790_length_317_cov_37.844037_2_plen_35_part_01